ncbi:hypothetical protein RIF29_18781 [Crotalaria pallida]|uniref:Uncharacterized protein n=1 Tax=Crotalaria pallida TaxID=3830 RepID=A0AAN9IAS5_CROPI
MYVCDNKNRPLCLPHDSVSLLSLSHSLFLLIALSLNSISLSHSITPALSLIISSPHHRESRCHHHPLSHSPIITPPEIAAATTIEAITPIAVLRRNSSMEVEFKEQRKRRTVVDEREGGRQAYLVQKGKL